MSSKRAKQNQISFGYCDTETGQRVYPAPSEDATQDLLPEQIPPEIKPVLRTGSNDDMYLKVTCWPPLGQTTTVPAHETGVKFTAFLETSSPNIQASEQVQVYIWHNLDGASDWKELPLVQTTECNDVLLIGRYARPSNTHLWFTGELPNKPKHQDGVQFTLKFRVNASHDWKWARDATGISDGELYFQPAGVEKSAVKDLKTWFNDVSSDIQITSERPDTDDTHLYSLTCPVEAAKGKESGWQHHQLGLPTQYKKWFSLVRIWSPWLAPRQGKGKFSIDKDGILASFQRTDGLHVVCLAISGLDDIVTTFFNDEHGNVIIKGRNDRPSIGTSRVLVAVAPSFEVANAAVMYHARKVIQPFTPTPTQHETEALINDKVKPEWLEEWYDGFTYCTWNGLGQNLTAEKIYSALDDLALHKINITNLIIDDNWQSLASGENQFVRGWSAFEANPAGFPSGLKATTTKIRTLHPNIQHIAVWHAILGYWGGIDPAGTIAQTYQTLQVEKEPGVAGGTFTVVAASDAKRMYDDFYSFLAASGVDSVKTDAQFMLDLLLHAPDRAALITEYQDAWTLAHLRHFSSRAISCMSQSPQMLFHSQLPTNKPRLLVRNSDDFFPDVAASHPWHIFCNAHNALFAQHLNVIPDWDMFQTSHQWSGFHAAARCVSGGPIYFTDYPGKHDIKLIRQMTAQTPRDKTVILRPHVVGKAMEVYNEYGAPALLKIGTYVGMARVGTGILGLFNVSAHPLSELLSLKADFPGTSEDGEYVVGSFKTGELSAVMKPGTSGALVGVEVDVEGWDILTAYALRGLEMRGKEVKVGMMGLLGKMTGSAAVTGFDVYVEENGRLRVWVSVKALGVLGVYYSDLPDRDLEGDFMVLIFGKPIPVECVRRNEGSKNVLEIDIEKAWEESGEKAGWNNEISLEIFAH